MKIRRLAVRNYRQYRELDLDFSDPRSDVTIVVGSNGTGKTNLLNAVIWCLYKKEPYYGRDMESSPLVTQSAIDDAQDEERIAASVTLELEFATGVDARVRRVQEFVKHGRSTQAVAMEFRVQELNDRDKGYEPVEDAEAWIERFVPRRLEPYFLFDGERLDNFFRHAEAQKIENAVLEIAQIDLLERLVQHLEDVAGGLYSKAGRSSGGDGLAALSQKNERLETELHEAENDVGRRKAEVEACELAVRMLESKIGNIKEIVGEIQRRKDLESDAKMIDDKLDEAWLELRMWSIETAPAVLASDALGRLLAEIAQARTEHRLPPPVDPTFLRSLLETHKACVCGSSLDPDTPDGSDHRHAIEDLLTEYQRISELGEALLGFEMGARDSVARVRHALPTADAIVKRIDDWQHRQETAEQSLKVLAAKLAGHDDLAVQQTESELSRAKEAQKAAQQTLSRREWEINDLRKEIAETQREIDRLGAKAERVKSVLAEAKFAKECLAVARSMYNELTAEVRSNVAASLQRHFKNMMWKQEAIGEVTIDDKYSVSVRNNRGYEILPDLAAGERECLALAFSLALSEVSGYELPMIIDTPMGRLNPDVQCFVAEVLAKSTQGEPGESNHQLLMLMTETEYNSDVADVLSVRHPKVLRIAFDQQESTARLLEER